MSYIYKITNDINNKIYIGKTNLTIQERFKQHYRDSQKNFQEKRPLYQAINKYGIDHFQIEEIEECLTEQASEREQYWIGFYKGYEQGYNATQGGDGKQLFNHTIIANELRKNPYPIEIAKMFNCSVDTVCIIANEFHIPIKNRGQENNVNSKKEIHQFDKKTNKFLQSFESVQKAAEWLQKKQIIKILNSGVRSHISEAARGKRKSAYGYVWQYKNIQK